MFVKQNGAIFRSYVAVHGLAIPFWGLFLLLPVILYKDLHASPLQITLLIAIKPLASFLSPYWNQYLGARKADLASNLLWNNTLKYLPFLLLPLFATPWFVILSFALFMSLTRAAVPAWMELLKLHVPTETRSRLCASVSTMDYIGGALLPLSYGLLLDRFEGSWKWLFPLFALIGLSSSLLLVALPRLQGLKEREKEPPLTLLIKPWKSSWSLLTLRRDYLHFQIGFFLGGAGLMIIQPSLPSYFVDTLHLSYSGILVAIATLKGIGFALSSPFWAHYYNRLSIFALSAFASLAAACSILFLVAAESLHLLLYASFLLYGMMQGGSELSWKLSGPLFSQEQDSTPYSSINVLAVGIRGLIFPFLGSLLFSFTQSTSTVLFAGALLCSISAYLMNHFRRQHQAIPDAAEKSTLG